MIMVMDRQGNEERTMKQTACVMTWMLVLIIALGAGAADAPPTGSLTPAFLDELTATVAKHVRVTPEGVLAPDDLLFLLERYVETSDENLSTLVKTKLAALSTRVPAAATGRVRLMGLFDAAHRVLGDDAYAQTAAALAQPAVAAAAPSAADKDAAVIARLRGAGLKDAREAAAALKTADDAPASIDDGLWRIRALLAAYEHTGELALRDRAEKTFDRVEKTMASAEGAALQQIGGVSRAAMRLYLAGGKDRFKAAAVQRLSAHREAALRSSDAAGAYGLAACAYVVYPYKFVVIGAPGARQGLLDAVFALPLVNRTILPVDPKADPDELARLGYPDMGRPAVFVCTDKTCSPSVTKPARLRSTLDRLTSRR